MNPLRGRLSRLPLRSRLVAGFLLAMFVVLLAANTFVYWRVEYALDRALDTELTRATSALEPLVGADGEVSDRSAAEATGAAWQVLDSEDRVLDHGGPASTTALVSPRLLAGVGATPRTFDVGDFLPISRDPYRVRVTSASMAPRRYLLVGVRRDHRDEALRELLVQLTVAGLGALVITAFVGERLARAALLPVERYRRRAAAIAAGSEGLRLDVPQRRNDEVTRLGHTLNDMLATLERALQRERQFVSEASHELRTPITLLTGRLQLARRRPRSREEHERILEELQVDLSRLSHLAERLLELGSATTRSNHPVTSDLALVTARIVEQRRLAAAAEAGTIHAHLAAGPLPVAVADVELQRILTNLLDNAAGHGAAPFLVTVDQASPAWARLTVRDAGPGMARATLATATRRFTRAAEARNRPGAGLGLALVQALLIPAGGELRLCYDGHHTSHGRTAPVECSHGPQMTVTVLLPAVPPSTAGPSARHDGGRPA